MLKVALLKQKPQERMPAAENQKPQGMSAPAEY